MPRRNLSAPVTDRSSRSRSPAYIRKQEGFPLGNCRYRRIPSPRERAPDLDSPRRLSRRDHLATERKATTHLIAPPTTRLLSTSTFKQTGTRMPCKLYVLHPDLRTRYATGITNMSECRS
jgi:hypothetical protein